MLWMVPNWAASCVRRTGHHAAVYGVARSPFFPKCFASAGDWTVRLWNEDVRAPLVASAYHAAYLSSVRWSPTRSVDRGLRDCTLSGDLLP